MRYTRRKGVIGLALGLLALGGGGAYQLAQSLGDTVDVIALAADVPRGEAIQASDLTIASVNPDAALTPIPAGEAAEVAGQRAAADLSAGSILTPAAVTAAVVPAVGDSVVGVAVTPQQLPTEPLIPGDRVRVVSTPNPGDDPPEAAPEAIEATVLSVEPIDTGFVMVNVIVDAATGAELAARVATGRVGIVLDSREHGPGQ
ncbi:SAF domain-containing protein [Phytoactinopolyspora halotolerans]|uniref:SAF domain-containing protein n=1 Tax=Phytoactinopolyspora halotolerans TaxID=1981512 RepID=A0A6L9S9I5_9ACTN|nr:SAF domain-containing protein [Phytoactinopolyspora halotolerans]NEE01178.1 hypothetical protein [Phytoactinopolyspora halotolerans]